MAAALDTKRYDRQIRLWGMETQLRITTTRVLICGVGGLAAEVAKNLVLAGVGHVTLRDAASVTLDDLARGGQFLLSAGDAGKNRAEASLPFLRGLNPSVVVESSVADIREATADELGAFDIVLLFELGLGEAVQLAGLARKARTGVDGHAGSSKRAREAEEVSAAEQRRVHVMAAGAAGLLGWALFDLGEYSFTETSKKKGADGETVSETRPGAISYPPLEEALLQVARAKQPADVAKVLSAHRALNLGEDMRESVRETLRELKLPADTIRCVNI
ncbi:hypothetical protein T492DRAFT_364336 [Pavlovales sp. CCMP2436]|nr:hypothetical protein T492DRAFT_364336 [Pavlovales sp. CCMP2436]